LSVSREVVEPSAFNGLACQTTARGAFGLQRLFGVASNPNSTPPLAGRYLSAMSSRLRTRPPAKKKTWRTSLILKHGRILGTVEAASRQAAEAAAVKMFQLRADQRKRLVVQEQG
jgi:hypothetical protein